MKNVSNEEFKKNKEVYYQQGKENENRYYETIKDFFNLNNYTVKSSRYKVIDWEFTNPENKEVVSIELKGRNNTKDKYDSTIYGMNKMNRQIKQLNNGKIQKAYACFSFTDGLYYYEITKDSLSDIEIKDVHCHLRGRNEYASYAHIPVNKLIPIKEL